MNGRSEQTHCSYCGGILDCTDSPDLHFTEGKHWCGCELGSMLGADMEQVSHDQLDSDICHFEGCARAWKLLCKHGHNSKESKRLYAQYVAQVEQLKALRRDLFGAK